MSSKRVLSQVIAALLPALFALFAVGPASAAPWPGGSSVSIVDGTGVFGQNLSGLAYQPSGGSAPGVLWAVRNSPPALFRLLWNGTTWAPDAANGWSTGKQLYYTNGQGVPDAEGVTLVEGDPGAVYVSTERNTEDSAHGNISRPSVLRYDISGAAATLTATEEFDLTADLPGLGSNEGLEGVGWVPDTALVTRGLIDESTGVAYDPSDYPGHGSGLFFVGVEETGQIVAYAFDLTNGGFSRVAAFSSGFPEVMEITYEPERGQLWAVCDNNCNGRADALEIAQSGPSVGKFVVASTYDRPSGMANLNNEGFAVAPHAECANGLKPVFYADDDNDELHALRAATIECLAGSGEGPPGGPGGSPPGKGPSDTKVDGSASIAKKQKEKGRRITVAVTVSGTEALTVGASGKVKAGKGYMLKPVSQSVAAGGSVTIRLKPAKKASAAKVAKFLATGRKAKASVSVTLADAAGNHSTQALSAKLTRR